MLAFACIVCFASIISSGDTGNRHDRALGENVALITKSPSSAKAYLFLLEILHAWDFTSPGKVEQAVAKIAALKKLHPQARLLLADFYVEKKARSGKFEQAAQLVGKNGTLTSWTIMGPFDNEDLKGQERKMGPELDLGDPFDYGLAFEGDERPVGWRDVETDPTTGTLFMGRYLHPNMKVCGYGGTYVESPKTQTAVFWGVSDGTLGLWVDGRKVIDDSVYRSRGPSRHASSVTLSKGAHQLLFKVCVDGGEWSASVRATNQKGSPLILKSDPQQKDFEKPYAAPAGKLQFKAYGTVLSELEKNAMDDEESAEAAGDYARYLMLTGSDDVKKKSAQDFAARAAEKSGQCDDYITLALTAEDANRSMEALRACLSLKPDHAAASYLLFGYYKGILHFPDLTGKVNALVKKFPDDPLIAILKARLFDEAGMPMAAFSHLTKLRGKFGDLPVILEELSNLAYEAADMREADALMEDMLGIHANNELLRADYIKQLVRRGDFAKAGEEIGILLKYFGRNENAVREAVDGLMAMQKIDEAKKVLMAETRLAPHNPDAWEFLGLFYNLLGEDKMSLACFQTVLELNPQNVQVRQYISKVKPEEKFETPYIKDEKQLAQLDKKLKKLGKNKPDTWGTDKTDLAILVDQEVDRVYENGTSSRFVQRSIRVNSEQGARLMAYQVISYSPGRQDLKILKARVIHSDGASEDSTGRYTLPVVEEEFRLYYDDANEIVEMPSMKAGDIVDLQYKLSDSRVRNMWERHFGNIIAVQSLYPKMYFRFDIITDKSFKLYVDTPSMAGMTFKKAEEEKTTVFRWEAGELMPILPEPEMPPLVELSPTIRVSTFGTWEELGKWWWDLASQQMLVDEDIRKQVGELTKDKKTDDEKIAAIFDWVIRSTRYVGLEFGIHGFKPYRTTEVIARGFGDCKDKATLLYTMLKEAGIDAAVVLVRTRGSGELNSSFPFQFLFDHAIAAVPAKNLFLDGTVEYLGHEMLPPADQGVFSIIVSEGKTVAATTTVLPAESNSQKIRIDMRIDGGGDALLGGKVLTKGVLTSHYRSRYQTTGTRKERFEEELSTIFPGVSLEKVSFEGLDDYSQDINVEFSANVPGLAMVSDDEIQLTALPSYGLFKKYASRSKRKYPVILGHRRAFTDHYVFTAPEGFMFTSLPSALTFGSRKEDGYSFSLKVNKIDPKKLEIEALLVIDTFRIEPDKYDRFREFCRNVDEATAQRIHIGKMKP
ncbi:MAG: DUF3857 domain-containing protein [Pseudomonadota bacterium]